MPNYKETTLTGSSFNRCRQIEITNPYEGLPAAIFTEERITLLSDRVLRDQPDAPIRADYIPGAVIAIYDPVTLLPTGATVTMQEVYDLLFSAYFHFAVSRDIKKNRVPDAAPVVTVTSDLA